jgi:UDP-N-acetylglucosamine 2-epimerase (non-hydrolysing)
MRILVAVGTRPEIIKLSPVITALRRDGHNVRVVATGQHSDQNMAGQIFDGLGYRPDVTWQLPQGSPSARVGTIAAAADQEFASDPADVALVLGDTDTAPLVALAARHRGVGVIHVEAGLRSFNGRSGEEVNRRVMAAMASLNLAPTELAAEFLLTEGVPAQRVHVVGNPVIDVLASSGVPRQPTGARRGILFTAHRSTNVDRADRLAELVGLLAELGRRHGPVVFPLHPRTRLRLDEAGLLRQVTRLPGVRVEPPLAFHDLLRRLSASQLVVTDSGGLQEEAAYFGLPAVVMRETTPRWEGVKAGIATLCGMDKTRVLSSVEQFLAPGRLAEVATVPCPYGTGDTGERIAALLRQQEILELLTPRECDFGLPGGQLLAGLSGMPR